MGVVLGVSLENECGRTARLFSPGPSSKPMKHKAGHRCAVIAAAGTVADVGEGVLAWDLHVEYELTLVFYHPRHPTIRRNRHYHPLPTASSTPLLS